MNHLYSHPLRVYLLLGALAIAGIFSGSQLPISLFPPSSQTTVAVSIGYGSYTPEQFFESAGKNIESTLQSIRSQESKVEKLTAVYFDRNVNYQVHFGWGADPEEAIKTIQTRITSQVSHLDESIRNSVSVHSWRENQGFFAVSFYSPMRSLDELHQLLTPLVSPIKSKVQDASDLELYNPDQKEITIKLDPNKLAQYQLTTSQIERAIHESMIALNGGNLKLGESQFQLSLPKIAGSLEMLETIRVSPSSQARVSLKDIAKISLKVSEGSRQRFKTSGVESLILFSNPKDGGNIKRMSDQIMSELKALEKQWPKDIQFKILVNPSEFIDKSISGVIKEVALAALLAVLVLFFFIGSFRNVITAAIEIPLSLLIAFLLMRLAGMNLNLISLGGLALSAGMNVDASVVVLENIFRKFEGGKNLRLSFEEKAQIVVDAVREVRLPIIASTIASLVVFFPLIFTNGLSNALLGDLAKAVIFSHGLSAIVALILVPTIRLHLLKKGEIKHSHSPIEPLLKKLETLYQNALKIFLLSPKIQAAIYFSVLASIPLLLFFVLPQLKKEVIGKPDSEWLIVGINSPLINTPKQMESEIEALEQDLTKKIGNSFLYTFAQIFSKNGNIMLRLRDKKEIESISAKIEDFYKSTATKNYYVIPWNPSELRIPDPPDIRWEISGGSLERRALVAHDLSAQLLENDIFDYVNTMPGTNQNKGIIVDPAMNLGSSPDVLSRSDLSHLLRTTVDGIQIEKFSEKNNEYPIYLRMPETWSSSVESLSSIPIGFEGKLIPLSALAKFSFENRAPSIYRENQQSLMVVTGKLKKNNSIFSKARDSAALEVLRKYKEKLSAEPEMLRKDNPNIVVTNPDQELQDSLNQLKWAILISIGLVFLTMVLQLGDLIQALLVLVAIPLGIIGVILSLYIFKSSLSLNSGLGTILLNGIAVANSIILVDFIRRLSESGHSPLDATITAAGARIRPILMTSLCTVLGMLPIAFGIGEGGKTLQPLGIAVCGGLWVSTLLTLFLVPSLQYKYLMFKKENN